MTPRRITLLAFLGVFAVGLLIPLLLAATITNDVTTTRTVTATATTTVPRTTTRATTTTQTQTAQATTTRTTTKAVTQTTTVPTTVTTTFVSTVFSTLTTGTTSTTTQATTATTTVTSTQAETATATVILPTTTVIGTVTTTLPQSTTTSTATSTVPASTTAPTTPSAPPVGASSYDTLIQGTQGLVGYWPLGHSPSAEADLSGYSHTGVYTGAPPDTTMPNGDSATDFQTKMYLTIPSAASFSIPTTGTLTWEAWIRPDRVLFTSTDIDGASGYVDYLGKCYQYSPTCEWEGRIYSQSNSQNRTSRISGYVFNPSAGLGSAADWQPTDASVIQTNVWHHVVAEYQTKTTPSDCNNGASYPGTIEIWVDGVQWNSSYHRQTGCMSQYSIVPKALSSPVLVGTLARDTWFPGAVGKFAIYSRLLTVQEIRQHYTAMGGTPVSGQCANTCTATGVVSP